jgi:DNA-binding NarL/FixJ family response regulator
MDGFNHTNLVRCVLVENELMFDQLLRTFLASESRLKFVGSAPSVAAGIDACKAHSPDLLLLDLSLPDGEGTEVARFLNLHRPGSQSIILSGQADTFVCPRDLRGHIAAVVSKSQAYSVLQQEIACLLRKRLGDRKGNEASRMESLTRREREIFRRIGEGMSSKEIASAEFISPLTVDTHRKNIAAKLGTSASSLVRLAAIYQFTDPMRLNGASSRSEVKR